MGLQGSKWPAARNMNVADEYLLKRYGDATNVKPDGKVTLPLLKAPYWVEVQEGGDEGKMGNSEKGQKGDSLGGAVAAYEVLTSLVLHFFTFSLFYCPHPSSSS